MGALVQERQGRNHGAAGFLIVPLFDAARRIAAGQAVAPTILAIATPSSTPDLTLLFSDVCTPVPDPVHTVDI